MKAGTLIKPHKAITDFKTLNEYLEDALQVPFEPKYVVRKLFNKPIVEAIDMALRSYEAQFFPEGMENFRIPAREASEVRVGIFAQERTGARQIEPNVNVNFDLVGQVKKTLLFCDSVLISSQSLVHRNLCNSDEQWLDWAFARISEYLAYGRLLNHRIVVPIPLYMHTMGDFDDPWTIPYTKPGETVKFTSDDEQAISEASKILQKRVPGIDAKTAESCVIRALMGRSECNFAGNAFDPYFKDDAVCEGYIASVNAMKNAMTSNDILTPLRLLTLRTGIAINPAAVSNDDLINLRENGDLFEVWRGIVRETTDHMYQSRAMTNDPEKELAEFARLKQADWDTRSSSVIGRSNFLKNIMDDSKEFVLGTVAGAAPALVLGTGSITTGALTSGARVLARAVGRARHASQNRPARISFDQHFLALVDRKQDRT